MTPKTLLIEIQTEDLPSQELNVIAKFFYSSLKKELKKNQIKYISISLFYTTKKITLKIFSLLYAPKLKYIKKIGPLVKEAFDANNKMTKIAHLWIKLSNISIEKIEKITIKKKKYLACRSEKKSISLTNLLKDIIPKTIKKIPLKKAMIWNNNSIRFSRPIRNIMVLLDHKIINLNLPGIKSHNISYGHFLMSPKKIIFNNANEYTEEFFKKKYIILDYQKRKKKIIHQLKNLAYSIQKIIYINPKLLKETALSVEWPTAYIGKFKKKYLKIPKEMLISIMENNQKYFPLHDIETNHITNNFIIISNIDTPNKQKIIKENEQVLNSKLSNINFFLKQDKKIKFSDRFPLLKKISFQKELGSMYEKTIRIQTVSTYISHIIHADIECTNRAAMLSKCDLTTNIIAECPFLQGSIGMHYALQEKENKKVALAIKEHYLPNSAKSNLPTHKISCALSIAEKIDTITGIFSIGKFPTHKKDPFALRRAAIGIIRIIIENKIHINLEKLVIKSLQTYEKTIKIKIKKELILEFIYSKYKSLYVNKKYNKKIILSVLSLNLVDLIDIDSRIYAIDQFQKKNNIEKILNIYKRIHNILSKKDKITEIITINPVNLQSSEKITLTEKKIFFLIQKIKKNFFISKKTNYIDLLKKIQKLCSPIEEFFKNSFIFDKNIRIRSYRIFLLKEIKKIFLYITNFSYLETLKNNS